MIKNSQKARINNIKRSSKDVIMEYLCNRGKSWLLIQLISEPPLIMRVWGNLELTPTDECPLPLLTRSNITLLRALRDALPFDDWEKWDSFTNLLLFLWGGGLEPYRGAWEFFLSKASNSSSSNEGSKGTIWREGSIVIMEGIVWLDSSLVGIGEPLLLIPFLNAGGHQQL